MKRNKKTIAVITTLIAASAVLWSQTPAVGANPSPTFHDVPSRAFPSAMGAGGFAAVRLAGR